MSDSGSNPSTGKTPKLKKSLSVPVLPTPFLPEEKKEIKFSFFGYLRDEIFGTFPKSLEENLDVQGETVYHFIRVPLELEKVLFLGYTICMDSFLFVFTFMPIRIVIAILALIGSIFSSRFKINQTQVWDLKCFVLLLISFNFLLTFDHSAIYHYIRGQSVLKLYVIFNVLEIFEKLCCSFGQDIIDALLSKTIPEDEDKVAQATLHLHPWVIFLLAILYTCAHSIVLMAQAITLNVAINSHNNALLTLLISNQFVELKGSVFKKFSEQNVFQITFSDIVERFQMSIFLMVITIRNFADLHWDLSYRWIESMFAAIVLVSASEVVVDWIKHAFITKFNHLSSKVYRDITGGLLRELIDRDNPAPSWADTKTITKRIGFVPLPLACLVLRMCQNLRLEIVFHNELLFSLSFFGLLFIGLCVVKILIRMFLVHAWFRNKSKYTKEQKMVVPTTPTRFSMQDGKIP